MAAVVYTLCAFTALTCALLLIRAYFRSRYRMLLWGGISFIAFTVGNIVLVADKIFLPRIDLATWRYAITLVAMAILFYGVVWDAE